MSQPGIQHPKRPLELAVPASTSNLGPGFDSLGLALSLFLRIRLSAGESGAEPRLSTSDDASAAWPPGPENLVLAAFEAVAGSARGLVFEARSEIPVGRGLGSSGAAVAAGLLLGAALVAAPPPTEELLRLGLELEGHPDNVTASLVGGCTLCLPRVGRPPRVLRPPLSPDLAFAVAWPDLAVSTAEARAVLPAEVPHADAVENARRLPILLEGLARGDGGWLRDGGQDRLHVRYRLALIPGAARALAAAEQAGAFLATISGSGSSLVAIADPARAAAVADAMAAALRAAGGSGTGRVVSPVLEAPRVRVSQKPE